MSNRRAFCTFATVVAFLCFSLGATALAGPAVLLGFTARYTAPDGATYTHHGEDIAWQAGAPVTAPLSGTISFAGRVPGPHGGSILVVSIDTVQGKVTLLPFEALSVTAGDTVEAYDELGSLAAAGDPSSAGAHLHVGLKRSGVYVDPAGLFALPAVGQKPAAEPAPVKVPAPAPVPAATPAPMPSTVAPRTSTSPVVVGSPVSAPAAQPSAVPQSAGMAQSSVSAAPEIVAGELPVAIERPAASMQVAQQQVGVESPVPLPGVAQAATPQTAPLDRTHLSVLIGGAARGLSELAEQPLGLGACASAVMGCALMLTRRSLSRRVVSEEPVSDRLGKMLRALRAGDTICGFTSCSGHSAFTDPGPPAQRR